jgi:type IX secretion system PorP/SprF family membrane protein
MFRKYSLALLLVIAAVSFIHAQQMPQTAHFMYNQLIYNPAAAGMHETDFNANLASRFQWGGNNGGGSSTNMFWTDYRLDGNKMAVGLNLNYDKFGATGNLDVSGNYAYYVPLNNKLKLSMGARFGMSSSRFNASDLRAWDPNDPVIESSNVRTVTPKAGLGFQLLSKNLYAGITVTDLIASDKFNIYGNKDRSFFEKRRNYIFMSGYRWKINDTYDLYPNVRLIYYPGAAIRADFNTIFEITDYFWAGVTISTSQNHAIMAGTHISSRIRFAYAYEFNTKANATFPLSTHEINIMLNLDDLFKH